MSRVFCIGNGESRSPVDLIKLRPISCCLFSLINEPIRSKRIEIDSMTIEIILILFNNKDDSDH